ncbi:MAG: hypothetical protein NTW96_27610 [Planctomycetia bacterium]|nr:hypothetical protein [Planctomycetia bacterium]
MQYKTFAVAALSNSRNSFGLRGVVLIAEDGEAWEVGVNHLCLLRQGSLVSVGVRALGHRDWATLGFEIPRELPDAPKAVVDEAWSTHRSVAAANEVAETEQRAPSGTCEKTAKEALLEQVRETLARLADAAGDVPEWNEGGFAFETAQAVREALR